MKPNDFKNMYGSTPDSFKRSISNALRKTEAEEPMKKKITIRTLLVTALLVLLIASVAIAATSQWTLNDYLTRWFGVSPIPKSAQEVLEQSGTETYILGGVKFTRQESIADGELAHITTKVESLDEDVILYPMMPGVNYGDMTKSFAYELNEAYGIKISATILEAAQLMQKKIYGVAVYVEYANADGNNDEQFGDVYLQPDTMVLINMLRFYTDAQEIELGYTYCFTEYDPLTGEKIEETILRETDMFNVPVQPVLGVRTFTAPDDRIGNDIAYLQSVTLTHKATGVYVETHLMAKDGVDIKAAMLSKEIEASYVCSDLMDDFVLMDNEGNEYGDGMVSGDYYGFADAGYPELQRNTMVAMESMPDHLTIGIRSEDNQTIAATYTLTDYTDEK